MRTAEAFPAPVLLLLLVVVVVVLLLSALLLGTLLLLVTMWLLPRLAPSSGSLTEYNGVPGLLRLAPAPISWTASTGESESSSTIVACGCGGVGVLAPTLSALGAAVAGPGMLLRRGLKSC